MQEYKVGYGPALSTTFVRDDERSDEKVYLSATSRKNVNIKEAEAIVRHVRFLTLKFSL